MRQGSADGNADKTIFSTRRPNAASDGADRTRRRGFAAVRGTRWLATRAARPMDVTMNPSAASCSKTAVTVVRDTPRSAARARVDGTRAPAGIVPSAIWPRSMA